MKLPRTTENGWLFAEVPCPNSEEGWWECIQWCIDQWGDSWEGEGNWKFIGMGKFEFRRVDMLTLFLLRWS